MELPELVAAVPLPVGVPAVTNPVELDLRIDESDRGDWCWAAVSLGIARGYKNTSHNMQCEIVTRIHKQDNGNSEQIFCCLPPKHKLDDCDQAHTLKEPLAPHHRQTIRDDPGHRTFPFVKDEIDGGRPVAVRLQFPDAVHRGHFVVISGYVPETEVLLVWDPDQKLDEAKPVAFTEFRDKYEGKGVWDQSYLTQGAAGSLQKVVRKAHQ